MCTGNKSSSSSLPEVELRNRCVGKTCLHKMKNYTGMLQNIPTIMTKISSLI